MTSIISDFGRKSSKRSTAKLNFGQVYPRGSLVIALVCYPLVGPSVGLSLNISRDCSLVFLKFFAKKLGHHMGTKVTEPDF